MARSRLVKIDIVSDTICPWCFVGKRRLDKGEKLFIILSAAQAVHSVLDRPHLLTQRINHSVRAPAAIDAVKPLGLEFEVRWRPFFLDPSLPKEGVDKRQRYAAKFGAARMRQMEPYMKAMGLQVRARRRFKGDKWLIRFSFF
jgi:predicted DsbA family dithiol-disulfide isomerase